MSDDATSATIHSNGSDIAQSANTGSAMTAETSGGSVASRSFGNTSLKGRRKVVADRTKRSKAGKSPSPTPLGADLPALREKVEQLLSTDEGEKEMFDMIKRDLLLNYMLEVQAGQDMEINPQHSRASRKQSKEIAELLIQLKHSDGS